MIQYSKDGEAIVEIPGRGLILGFRPQMQRVFGQRLIGGRVMKLYAINAEQVSRGEHGA